MKSVVKHTRIAGICAAVPKNKLDLYDRFPKKEMDRLMLNTGIREIRVAPKKMCVSDMCTAAAERVLKKLKWEKSSVGLLIFISQGADLPLPATACLIQNRMGLPLDCAAFDINLGCSGYVYGLWIVSQLLTTMNVDRALLLVGDKSANGASSKDRSTLSLFGDAGAATAIERSADENIVHYVGGTDGSGGAHLHVKCGGARYPIPLSRKGFSKERYDKLIRDTTIHLSGGEVFGFALRTIPTLINNVLAEAKLQKDQVDYYVFHQANKFILEHISKKLGLSREKVVIDLEKWGNTSSASIPLALCDMLGKKLKKEPKTFCLAGFGVGWSWMACTLKIGNLGVAEVYEIPEDFVCSSGSV